MKRNLLSASARTALLGVPTSIEALSRYYLLSSSDHDLVLSRRRPENRLGLALHIALLRHPGTGWRDDAHLSPELISWLAEQIDVAPSVLGN